MTNEEKKLLTKEIQVQRLRADKTQEECANVLNISVPTYRELEYNPNKIDLEQLLKLGEYLNCNFFQIFLNNILQNAIKEKEE